jgi:tetratricopeptide (TPR) repeat protein
MRPMRLYGSESEMMAWVRSALSSQTLRIAGHAKLHLGKEEEAVTWLRRSIEANRNYPASRFYLAAALAHLGRLPEARSEAEAGLALNPVFSISRVRAITQRVTIRLFSPDANTSTTDCTRPEPRSMTMTRRPAAIMAVDVAIARARVHAHLRVPRALI